MSSQCKRGLYGKLAGDTTLNALLGTPATGFSKAIYYQEAPAGAAYPYVIFDQQSGVPTEAFTDPSALETDVWLVRAVDRNTTADIAEAIQRGCSAAQRHDTVDSGATLCISAAARMSISREHRRHPVQTQWRAVSFGHNGLKATQSHLRKAPPSGGQPGPSRTGIPSAGSSIYP